MSHPGDRAQGTQQAGTERPQSPQLMKTMGVRQRSQDFFPLVVRGLLLAAALIVGLWFLLQVQRAVLVLTVAVILAVFLNAPVIWLERHGVSRRMGAIVVLVALLAIAGLLGWLVLPRLTQEIPRFLNLLPQITRRLAERLASAFGDSPAVERQLSMLVAWVIEVVRGLWQHASAVLGAFLLSIVVLALVLYMLLDPAPLLVTYLRLMPEHLREPAARAFKRSSEMIVQWAIANLIIGFIRAVAVYFFLQWMGVPGALLWSILAFVTAMIPQVGFYLMAIPPVFVAAAQSTTTALWTALFYVAFSEIFGNFVVPRIRGETMRLHPAYLLAVTLLMAFAFGLIGVLIAAPVAGIVKAYVEEFYMADQADDPRIPERVARMLTPTTSGRGDT